MYNRFFGLILCVSALGSVLAQQPSSLPISYSPNGGGVTLHFSKAEYFEIGYHTHFLIWPSGPLQNDTSIVFKSNKPYVCKTLAKNVTLLANSLSSVTVNLIGYKAGKALITASTTSREIKNINDVKINVMVVHWKPLQVIVTIIGWIYFVAWSISFYPQVYENWKRKSVIGLNFDFLAYNWTGFFAYSVFNLSLFWIKDIQDEYFQRYPDDSVIPVQPNDVFFALHAICLTTVTIFQCFLYERGDQRVSKICVVLITGAWLFAGISLIVALCHKLEWLTYLYYFSYIKLGVTLIKYIPQAYMNFRRKSTTGWSIGNVLLDFTGGSFSIIQMFLISYNSNEWDSIFGDFTKFGLGAFSILFDILFMVQHYVLYRRKREYQKVEEQPALSHKTHPTTNPVEKANYGALPSLYT